MTHGHFDHLLDVPEIARRTAARVIASPTSCHLSQAAGVSASETVSLRAGDSVRLGSVRVHALPAVHDLIFGVMPFPGLRASVPRKAPVRPSDWVCGEPLAFLVEIGGKRIYVDSGGTPAALPPMEVGPVDLAILGVSLPDSRKRLVPALRRLRPRYVLPSHQDDFFRPLSDGFRFGSMTNFSAVLRSVEKYRSESLPAGPPDPPGLLRAMDAKLSWGRFRHEPTKTPCDPTMKTFAPLSRFSKRDP